jgi:outer membrane lipoprotein-sorting protein
MNFSIACALGLALGLAALPAPAQESESGTGFALESLLETMTTTSGLSAEFAERKELALLSAPLESRGRLYFVPPDRFARFTTQPEFTALVIDGDHVRFREGADADELDLSANPLTRAFVDNFVVLWSGDRERLERLYTATLRVEGERWELSLAPRDARLARFLEAVVLRGRGRALEQMIVRDRDGDRTVTTIRSLRLDRSFSADELERIFASGMPADGPADGR